MQIQQRAIGQSSEQYAALPGEGRFLRCMILDDSQFDRFLVRRLASNTGLSMHVTDAEVISELVALIEKTAYDLFIIDYRLNSGTGLDAVRIIRENTLNKDAAVIMISGATDADVAAQAVELGCSNFLYKENLSANVMRRAIAEAVDMTADASGTEADMPQSTSQHRESAKHLAIAALKASTQTIPELDEIIAFLQDIQQAPNRKERDRLLRKIDRVEASCMNIRNFLDDISKKGRQRLEPGDASPQSLL